MNDTQTPGPCHRNNPHTPHGACPGTAPEYPSERIEILPDPPAQRPVLGIAGLAAATTQDEMYGALASLGHAFMRAGQGITTEIREDNGTVVALITPPGGPS